MTEKKATKRVYRLGKRIQKVRNKKDLLKKNWQKSGRSTTWLGYIETGYRRPNLKMIYKIAKALGVKNIFPF